MRYPYIKPIGTITLITSFVMLSGCAAIAVESDHSQLSVQSRMSRTIFLDPTSDFDKTIYLQVRNSSGIDFSLEPKLANKLRQAGYIIVHRVNRAHYMLQVNVLHVGRSSVSAANKALDGGFGSTLATAGIGAGIGGLAGGGKGAIIGGLIGAAVNAVSGAAVKDVTFVAITDVRVSTRRDFGEWKHQYTRIVTTANRVNLKFDEAVPPMRQSVTSSIAGIF